MSSIFGGLQSLLILLFLWSIGAITFGYEHYNQFSGDGTVYRPMLSQHMQDPNILMVPRLGLIAGQRGYKIIKNRPISSFRNLKYGTVGHGPARFQKAIPMNYGITNKIIDATKKASSCPQFPEIHIINTTESRGEPLDDCLTLNIYTPDDAHNLPVIVFVHGEMLFDGSADEGQPDYFLEHDVVLVTINYRLAPFGFLSTLSDEMPGNAALADLHMALEWIQEFIRPFGGDSEKVTLMGQAGGATLVHALSLSNKTQGLFHKLILQSGTALNPYFIDEDPLVTARSFARLARCSLGFLAENIANCLGRMSTTELLSLMERHWEANEPHGLRFTGGFKLTIGDKLGYLEHHPAALLGVNNYPLLAGVTKDVGAFIMSRVMFKQLQKLNSANITDYIDVVLSHIAQPRHYSIWQKWALQHIFEKDDIQNPSFNNIAQGLLELINLICYRGPIIDSIRYSFHKNPSYLYCFDYRGQYHRFGHLDNPLPFAADATLSDDSIFLFPYPEEVSQLNVDDKKISRTMVTMWVNFAQYNTPNTNTDGWPNVTSEYGPFLRISNSPTEALELDYHFGEGVPVPSLYSKLANHNLNATSTKTTRRPWYGNNLHGIRQNIDERKSFNHRPYETVLNGNQNYQFNSQSQQQRQHYPSPTGRQYE